MLISDALIKIKIIAVVSIIARLRITAGTIRLGTICSKAAFPISSILWIITSRSEKALKGIFELKLKEAACSFEGREELNSPKSNSISEI